MKRLLMLSVAAAALALLPMAAAADERDGDHHFGPFAGASPDSGTCGPNWAADTFTRNFVVHRNADGTVRVVEFFSDGTFVTTGLQSPGACETSASHGSTVVSGITGHLGGFLDGAITGATTFNPNGCDTAGACNTTRGFVAAVFGPGAEYGCVSGPGSCSFFFEYTSGDQRLIFRHWINASSDLGGNRGDIATA
jgi:hypothetical protein